MSDFSIAEAKNNLPRLVQKAEAGEAVRITRRGRPVAVLLSEGAFARLSGQPQGFMTFLSQWRAEQADHPDAFAHAGDFENLRDRSPGRDFSWE